MRNGWIGGRVIIKISIRKIKIHHVLRLCHSSKKNNRNSNTNKICTIHCISTMCQAVYALLYRCPNSQGGGYKGTDQSGIKTLLPFKYFKPYYLRLTLPPLNWFQPSLKSLNWSLEKSVSSMRDCSSSKSDTAVFHYWALAVVNVDPWSSFPN